jgi:hypothetical protein
MADRRLAAKKDSSARSPRGVLEESFFAAGLSASARLGSYGICRPISSADSSDALTEAPVVNMQATGMSVTDTDTEGIDRR